MTANIVLVQPPFTQLNSPYPAIFYLRSFLEQRGYSVMVRDHSIGLFDSIFCTNGLVRIFADVRRLAASGAFAARGRLFISTIERFLTDEGRWLSTIDRLVAFLRGSDREWGYLLTLANGTLPEGIRLYRHIAECYPAGADIPPDQAPRLATMLLADLADFITETLDERFSLVRYAGYPAGAAPGFRDFAGVQAALDGYIMNTFYRPFLEAEWNLIDTGCYQAGGRGSLLLGLSIPFPGCLAGALVCAASARRRFGDRLVSVAGGGYVNTELRCITDESFFDYVDYLSFDRGYASLDAILQNDTGGSSALYKTAFRCGSKIVNTIYNESNRTQTDDARIDDEAAATVFPDYSGVDFSRYIRPVDDVNPMHRLWSDGKWLKAYTAWGCYWHHCAFCDVSLDYIRCYRPVDVDALFRHLLEQARVTGIHGVHLVDEACPPAALVRLALLNREAGLPLVFWGNIRFESAFTPDVAAILASGGLIGVSAGIEVATNSGLDRLGKGIDLPTLVESCAAFKEAGVLVHAYLIYGYWDEDAAEIIDSAETVRQFFSAGLLDSAFWHQFSLTVHSRVYAEQRSGLHQALQPECVPCPADDGVWSNGTKIFALNDISFKGENRFNRFAAPLERLLARWMRGDTENPVREEFAFDRGAGTVPEPAVAPGLVNALLDTYARKRDRNRRLLPFESEAGRALFLGSRPMVRSSGNGVELWWRRCFTDCTLRPAAQGQADTEWLGHCAALLEEAASGSGVSAAALFAKLKTLCAADAGRVWKLLRKQGLILW